MSLHKMSALIKCCNWFIRNPRLSLASSESHITPTPEITAYISGSCSRWQTYITLILFMVMILHGMNMSTTQYIAPTHINYHCAGDQSAPKGKHCKYPNGTKCEEFEFSNDYGSDSAVERWLIVCDEEKYLAYLDLIFRVGLTMSYILSGYLGDRYGRKQILFFSVAAQSFVTLFEATSTNYQLFVAAYFLFTLSLTSTGLMIIVLVTEITSNKWRTFILGIMYLPICAALILLPYICKLVGHLVKINLFISIPQMALFLFFYYIHESPCWLLINNEVLKTERIMFAATRINKNELPSSFRIRPTQVTNHPVTSTSSMHIWRIFVKWYIYGLFTVWFIEGYCVCICLTLIESDEIYTTVEIGITSIISLVITIGLCHLLKHQIVFNVCSFLGNVLIVITFSIIKKNAFQDYLIMKFCCLFFVTGSVSILWNVTPRMFATIMRAKGFGICLSLAQIGYLVAQFTFGFLWQFNSIFYLLYAFYIILCFISSYSLFNVHNRELPDTIDDMVNFETKHKPLRWSAIRAVSATLDEIEISVTDLQKSSGSELSKRDKQSRKEQKKSRGKNSA